MRSQISVLWARATTLIASALSLSPAMGRSVCRLARTISASVWASAASLLPPEVESVSRYRATCNGLIAYTR